VVCGLSFAGCRLSIVGVVVVDVVVVVVVVHVFVGARHGVNFGAKTRQIFPLVNVSDTEVILNPKPATLTLTLTLTYPNPNHT
jgi:hypothetical protein